MLGPTPLRDTGLVAGFELREMLRSRRAYVVVTLYLMVAAATTYAFVLALAQTEAFLANPVAMMTQMRANPPPVQMQPPGTDPAAAPEATPPAAPGRGQNRGRGDPSFMFRPQEAPPALATSNTQRALFSPISPVRAILRQFAKDDEMMLFLINQPPIALFYALVCMMFIPVLVVLTASEPIAQDLQTRRVRFLMLRTGRAEFVAGKMLGQALLLALVTLLSGAMCLFIAWWRLPSFELGPSVASVLMFWPRILAYCLPFVGLAAFCSMNSSSALSAQAFSLLGLAALWLADTFFTRFYTDSSIAPVLRALDHLLPYTYQNDLWYPGSLHTAGIMAVLVGLGMLYGAAGLGLYRRKDL